MTNSASTSQSTRHPVIELLERYGTIFVAVWALRHELAGPRRLADEAAFLPAALSLQETPVHPAPRRAAWAICALFIIALTWATFGQVDIMAVAAGRIVVSDRTKIVQPLEAGVVKRVLVKDGDVVTAGQVLVELDATNANADSASLLEQLAAARSEEQRVSALSIALRTQRPPRLDEILDSTIPAAGADETRRMNSQLQAEWLEITAKIAKFEAEHSRRQSELKTVQHLIKKHETMLPLARQRETDMNILADQGFMSGHVAQDRVRERIEMEADLATQHARLDEALAALAETRRARQAFVAETERDLSERGGTAKTKRQLITQEIYKADQRARLNLLLAPVSGTVQQLAAHTDGGVVTPAQVLMVIVPQDPEVLAEVIIENKDIGFIKVGQTVSIKLETFPFTRYGTVSASVKTLAADAVQDEKNGTAYPALLGLHQSSITVNGRSVNLSPGMNLTAEIKTGSRRVIDYLLDPAHRITHESMRER